LRWAATEPWFAPYRSFIDDCAELPAEAAIELLNGHAAQLRIHTVQGHPIRFVAVSENQPRDAALGYEQRIAANGEVETRTGPHWGHDFFNACVWLRFPAVKAALNAIQVAERMAAPRGGAVRSARADRATLFDESGALIVGAGPRLAGALAQRDWSTLFIAQRNDWIEVEVIVIGHGLLDKMRNPFKSVAAQAWLLDDESVNARDQARIDRSAALQLQQWLVRAESRRPLPLAGIPGWCEQNRDLKFYDDAQVFR
jgi:hypothetical protein